MNDSHPRRRPSRAGPGIRWAARRGIGVVPSAIRSGGSMQYAYLGAIEQLEDAIAAADLELSEDELSVLEATCPTR